MPSSDNSTGSCGNTNNKTCTKLNKKCAHNNWDNVRAERKVITLRCRECQKQQRIYTTGGSWKCQAFLTAKGCPDGSACEKYHINNRKQSLEERVSIHGMSVVNHVRLGKVVGDVHRKIDELKEKISTNTAHSTALSAIQDMLEAPEVASDTSSCESFSQQPAAPVAAAAPQQTMTQPAASIQSIPIQCVPQQIIAPTSQPQSIVIQTQPQQQQLTPPQHQFIFQQTNTIPMTLASCGAQQMCYQPLPVLVPTVYTPMAPQWVA